MVEVLQEDVKTITALQLNYAQIERGFRELDVQFSALDDVENIKRLDIAITEAEELQKAIGVKRAAELKLKTDATGDDKDVDQAKYQAAVDWLDAKAIELDD
jgi:hypothetical protein